MIVQKVTEAFIILFYEILNYPFRIKKPKLINRRRYLASVSGVQ